MKIDVLSISDRRKKHIKLPAHIWREFLMKNIKYVISVTDIFPKISCLFKISYFSEKDEGLRTVLIVLRKIIRFTESYTDVCKLIQKRNINNYFCWSFKPCKIILVVRSYFVSQQRVIETGVGGWLYCSTLVLKLPYYSYVLKSSHIKGIYIDRCFSMFLMHLLGITVIANWKFLDIPARNVWIAFCRCELFSSFMTYVRNM